MTSLLIRWESRVNITQLRSSFLPVARRKPDVVNVWHSGSRKYPPTVAAQRRINLQKRFPGLSHFSARQPRRSVYFARYKIVAV
jgi:hypothetical protein